MANPHFRRLEPRRVLNASFAVAGNDLTLSNFDATETSVTVSYDNVGNNFQFTLSTGNWFTAANVDTGSGLLSISQATLTGALNITSAFNTDVIFNGNIAGVLGSANLNTLGDVTSNPGTTLTVTNNFAVTNSSSVDLGDNVGDNVNFGSLTFNSTGTVFVTEQSDINLAGASAGTDIRLTAVGAGSDIVVGATVSASEDLFLDADGNVTQSAAISASGLALRVTGTTTLDNAANNVTRIAADNGGETLYTDANTLLVASVTVDGTTITGVSTSDDDVRINVNLGDLNINQAVSLGNGDLLLDVTGNVAQAASISSAGLGLIVDGTTTLDNAANNVTRLAVDNDGQTLFTDANGLIVGAVTVNGTTVTGIATSDDDVRLAVNAGNLSINQAIALGGGDLLLQVAGDVTQSAAITATGLGLIVGGATTLDNAANNVTTFAADNDGQTLFTDANGLIVGAVTVSGTTVTGIATSDDDVRLAVNAGNLSINQAIALGGGDLLLQVAGDVTQAAAITATGLGLIVGGATTLDNAANNVTTFAADNDGQTLFTDANGLIVGAVTVNGTTVTGIATSDDDVRLAVNAGNLSINQAIALGGGDLLLQVAGDVTQAAAITATGLGLIVGGATTLDNAANNVTTFAADNDGQTLFTDANGLIVGAVTVNGTTVTGIATSDDDVRLAVNAGNLSINQAIALGGGDLLLQVAGDVTQAAAITATGLGLIVGGATTLDNVANNVTTFAADNDGQTLFTDANGLIVGAVTVNGTTVTGIATSDDDVRLAVNAGNLSINQAITLGGGDLLLQVAGDVTQSAAITATGLGLIVGGTTTLDNAANNVTTFAADNDGQTLFTDANGLIVGAVTVNGTTVTGIATSDDDVRLAVNAGNLSINQAIALGGGDLLLQVAGDVTQSAAITATGLGLIVGGTTTLDNAANNVTTFAADNDGQTLFTDANGLIVGAVTVNGTTVTGIATSDDDVRLAVNAGNLSINQAIALGGGDLLLQVAGDVTQSAAITATGLGLIVGGATTLDNAANNVTTFAADNDGQTLFTDANGLIVGAVTVSGTTVTGIATSDDDVRLRVNVGNLSINQAVALGTGDLLLDVTGNVVQTAAITASGLGLIVDGTTTLTNAANNVSTLAAANVGFIRYTNFGALLIGSVTVADTPTITDVVTAGDIEITAASIGDADPAISDLSTDYDVDGANVTLTATTGSIGSISGDPLCDAVFNVLEVRATGNLVVNATNGVAAITGPVGGTTTISALSGVLQSDGDLDASGLDASLTTNLYLIADADRNGVGNLTISPLLSVTGDLRVQGADIISGVTPIVLRADRILFVSNAVESISVSDSLLNATPLVLDARAADLTVTIVGDIQLRDLDCDNVALASTSLAGNVQLTSTTGSVSVFDDVIAGYDQLATTSTGNVLLRAGVNLNIHDAILSDNGNITLQANNDVRIELLPVLTREVNDTVIVTSFGGSIEVTADFDNSNNGNGGELFMSDGARIIAGRDNVGYIPGVDGDPSPTTFALSPTAVAGTTVTMSADENVTIGSVQSADNSVNAIRVTSKNAGIVDGGDSDIDFAANNVGALVTLRAVTGIGNGNALETTIYAVDANNTTGIVTATSGNVLLREIAAGGDLNVVRANNGGGDIQVQVDAGTLTVVDAAFTPTNGFNGVTTNTGNILLRASADVIVNFAVTSTSGNITLDAGDDVDVNVAVGTGGTGDIYVEARNGANDAVLDGISIDAAITAGNGSILLRSQQDIQTNATITSTGGDIGLSAARDVLQNFNISAAAGNVAVQATRDYVMAAAVSTVGAGAIAATAGRNVQLARLTANNVGITAGGNITDANGTGVVNVAATNLIMRAGQSIGSDTLPIETTVDNLAINSGGESYVTETNNLTIANLPAIAVTVSVDRVNFEAASTVEQLTVTTIATAGITTSNDDVRLIVGGSLVINAAIALGTGDLLLDVTGDVTQTAGITAAGLGLIVDGNTILNNGANDVAIIAVQNGGGTAYSDLSDLVVGAVTVGSTTVTGITTTGDDVVLNVGGSLQINQAVALGAGELLLQVTGDVTQTAAITANGLGLIVGGITILNNATNNVVILAANNQGATVYNDVDSLDIGTVDIDPIVVGAISVDPAALVGLTTSGDDVVLTVGGSLRILQAVALGSGDLLLTVTGDVTQTATITANGLGLIVGGTTILNGANNINTLAANNQGATVYNDINDLVIGTIDIEAIIVGATVVNPAPVNGLSTSGDDVVLTVAGSLQIAQAVALGTGDLLLTVTGDITQTAAITANGLELIVGGITILNNTANNVGTLVANNQGATVYTDADNLIVGTVNIDPITVGATTVDPAALDGLTTSGDDVVLNVGGSLQIAQAVVLGAGDLLLNVTGDVTQSAAITANGLGLIVGGITNLNNAGNNVSILAANNQGATVYNDVDSLTIGTVDIEAITVGATTVNPAPVIGITTSVDVFLTVGGNLTQVAAITARGLGLDVTGTTTLENPTNNVTTLAGDNDGTTSYVDANDLTIGTVGALVGLTTSNDNIVLTAGGSLVLAQVVNAGTGNVSLTAAAHVSSVRNQAVTGNVLTLDAGTYVHLSTNVNQLTVNKVQSNGALSLTLNAIASDEGDDFLSTLNTAIDASVRNRYNYVTKFGTEYALYIHNAGTLAIDKISAGVSAAPNIYVETQVGNLNIVGDIKSESSNGVAGGVVLIAGGTLTQTGSITASTNVPNVEAVVKQIGLAATFYNGGSGVGKTSTEYVNGTFAGSSRTYDTANPDIDGLNPNNDYYQRVVMQFGSNNEKGFTTYISYADGKIAYAGSTLNSTPTTFLLHSASVVNIDRKELFTNEFLTLNPNLPTNAIVRRADNIFLFQSGGNEDLTFAAAPIENVKSQGALGGGFFTPEPDVPTRQIYVATVVEPVVSGPAQPPLPQIELPSQVQKSTEVAIYRVNFDDENQNGQVEEAELPDYEEALKKQIKDSRKVIDPEGAGKTPTQEDIEREKLKMLNDPSQPTGAYAIIRVDGDGNETVLDVFGVRDWEEEQQATTDSDQSEEIKTPKLEPYKADDSGKTPSSEVIPSPVPVPAPKDSDSSQFTPATRGESETRLASAGLLLGSLWMLRASSQGNSSEGPQSDATSNESSARDYGRRARRSRLFSK